MGLFFRYLIFALLASAQVASTAMIRNFDYEVKESIKVPFGWEIAGRAPPEHIIELRIALPQSNFDTLERHLYEVSDPAHSRYGSHLSKSEVEALVAPSAESLNHVNEWLLEYGFSESNVRRSPAKDWIIVKMPVVLAEAMLQTTYYVWIHTKSGEYLVRTLDYSLPMHLHSHIDVVQPTTSFARARKQATTFRWSGPTSDAAVKATPSGEKIRLPTGVSVDANCNSTITITCLKELYNAVGFNSSATNGNQIAVTGYLEQFANIADLQSFYALERPDALHSSFKLVSVNGGQNPQNGSLAGVEANLDTQFAFGLTFPTPATFFSTAGMPPFIPDLETPTDTNEPYTTWLEFILSDPTPPQTISTSYDDDEQTVPVSFARRVCNEFAQLGARGVSLMFSSGDGGVGDGDPDPATQECISNDGRNVTRFLPEFPSSCPFVTSVGATTFIPEVAIFFSGGGFSNVFPRPSYQDAAVGEFLQKLPKGTFEGLFNASGRGIPDVAAQGNNFLIFVDGQSGLVGGTSASSPTFAGFVSLLNDARLSSGKTALGFLNPLLYSVAKVGLNDITVGNNPGCGTQGFNATVGWDPITGLGTPNFAKLKAILD